MLGSFTIILITLGSPLVEFWDKIAFLGPRLLELIIIFVAGFLVGWLLKLFIKAILTAIRFDRLCFRIGFSAALQKASIIRSPTEIIALLTYWIVVFLFILAGFSALEVTAVDKMIASLFSYLPHFLLAILVFVIGYLLAQFLSRALLIALVNAEVKYARFISGAVQILIIFLFVAMGIEQLGIARGVVVATFSIFFGGVILALAIAFGLGGKDIAKEILEKRMKPPSETKSKPDEISHI
jgi:hypothetical protein